MLHEKVEAVAMNFWNAFISQTEKLLPEALIVYDKFHISRKQLIKYEKGKQGFQKEGDECW